MHQEFYEWLKRNQRKLKENNKRICSIEKRLLPKRTVVVICSLDKIGSVVVKENREIYFEILSVDTGNLLQSQTGYADIKEDAESFFELLLEMY